MTYPIPAEAFDDRLAAVGTSGSGKTYAMLGALARLLKLSGSRMIAVDALGVMWGLRLLADGKTPSGLDIVVFGGPHGDLPINEHAGKLIGETVSTMRESVILDLSELGSDAAERRFVLAFLTALYRNMRKDLTHLIFDEADMWAPQLILDREGDAMKLLGMMKTIVRRGRVKGFIPWLITQRPAELSKSVLSMMDGIVAMGMTGEQDRDAVGGWIRGQADKKTGQAILDSLPGKQIGEGVVWVPRRKILLPDARFPANKTFDSSRAPKRGEKRQKVDLPPIDLTKLQARMAIVVEEAKANDPVALKAELAETRRLLAKANMTPAASQPVAKTNMADQKAQERALAAARAESSAMIRNLRKTLETSMKFIIEINASNFFTAGGPGVDKAAMEKVFTEAAGRAGQLIEANLTHRNKEMEAIRKSGEKIAAQIKALLAEDVSVRVDVQHNEPFTLSTKPPAARPIPQPRTNGAPGDKSLTGPQRAVLEALAWWAGMGHEKVTRAQLAGKVGWKVGGSNLRNRLADLSSAGLITYPSGGLVALTPAGTAAAPEPDLLSTLVDSIHAMLTGPQDAVFEVLRGAAGKVLSKEELGAALNWEPTGSNLRNRLADLSSLEIIHYPQKGSVALQDWVTA